MNYPLILDYFKAIMLAAATWRVKQLYRLGFHKDE